LKRIFGAACAVAALGLSTSALAQDAAAVAAPASPPAPVAQMAPVAVAAPAPSASLCELHVWPTNNYLGMNTGLLSGFGLVGALADVAAHKDKVKTVKDLMRDYLGPDIQMEELNRIGLLSSLGLPADTRIVLEEPTPFNEELKTNPALKAKVKEMNATFKAGKRLSASQSPCYSELVTNFIFYQKAMMYGSNLFTFYNFRNFGDKPVMTLTSSGMVKNPLENFPPKTPEMVDAAKTELRNAYVLNYREWLLKKKKT
jgi:hypothetical protein